MLTLVKEQHIEGMYFSSVYGRIDIVDFDGKKAFMSIALSPGNGLIDPNPFNTDFTFLPNLASTLLSKNIEILKQQGYIYINEIYVPLLFTLNEMKVKFLEKHEHSNLDIKTLWYQYKLINLENFEIEMIDQLKSVENTIYKAIDSVAEDYTPNLYEIVSFAIGKHFSEL